MSELPLLPHRMMLNDQWYGAWSVVLVDIDNGVQFFVDFTFTLYVALELHIIQIDCDLAIVGLC